MIKLAVATLIFYGNLGLAADIKVGPNQVEKRKERIIKVFNELNKDTMSILDTFYHPNLTFQDPLGELHGLASMKSYYTNMYKNVKSIRFEFSKVLQDGSEYIAFWKMYLAAPGLNSGEEFGVEGNSHIRFDDSTDLVIYHRDYFDMGDFIYERIPVLKNIIKYVKQKLAH